MEKTCRRCEAVKPVDQFHRNSGCADGHDSICKACSKLKTEAWRAANPGGHARIQSKYRAANREKVNTGHAKWRKKHGLKYERARYSRRQNDPAQYAVYRSGQIAAKNRRRAAGPLTAPTVREILKCPCAYCGGVADTIDHILPTSRGGTNARKNLAPACMDCNRRKANRTPAEWRAAERRAA